MQILPRRTQYKKEKGVFIGNKLSRMYENVFTIVSFPGYQPGSERGR